MPLVRVKYSDPDEVGNKYASTYQVWVVAIDVPTETAIIVHKRKFRKINLNEVEWDAYE